MYMHVYKKPTTECICIAINNFGIVYILDVIDKYHTCDKDVVTVITTLIRSITVSSLVISTSGDHHFISIAFIHSGKKGNQYQI